MRGRSLLFLLVMTAVIAAGVGTCVAQPGDQPEPPDITCPDTLGWTKVNASASTDVLDADDASLEWGDGQAEWTLPAGAILDLCVKSGTDAFDPGDPDTGGKRLTLLALDESGSVATDEKDISHVAWRFTPSPGDGDPPPPSSSTSVVPLPTIITPPSTTSTTAVTSQTTTTSASGTSSAVSTPPAAVAIEGLAHTGSDANKPTGLALGLVAVGLVLLVVARVRRR